MRLTEIARTAAAMLWPSRPIILFHQPTARCDCRCTFCLSWQHQPDTDDVLPTPRVRRLIDRAHAAGMTMYTAWGGEPLLAQDLPVWLRHAKRLGMRTVVCTSGRRLPERAGELAPHVDRLLISLEAVGDRHDELRRQPGTFDRALAGLRAFRDRSPGDVVLWSNVSPANADQIESIAELAATEGVQVEFFPTTAHLAADAAQVFAPREQAEVFRRVQALKCRGLPISNTSYALELMRSARPFRCNIPALSVQLLADGRIYACDPRMLPELTSYGHLENIDLAGASFRAAYRRTRRELQTCNRCRAPCATHIADTLFVQATRRVLGQAYDRLRGGP